MAYRVSNGQLIADIERKEILIIWNITACDKITAFGENHASRIVSIAISRSPAVR